MTKTGKLNYAEFRRLIYDSIPKMLPEEYSDAEVVQKQVYKVNQTLDSFTISKEIEGERVAASPVFYVDELFERFQHGYTLESLISYITDALQRGSKLEMRGFAELDFDRVKDKITMELINHEKNECLLENIVHSDFLDLAFIYRIEFSITEGSVGSIMITKDMLKAWEVEEEELHRIAYRNMKRMHPAVLSRIFPPSESEENITKRPVIYALTNAASTYGATALIFNSILQRISTDVFKGNFYILPSSLHEVLLTRYEPDRKDELRTIIKDANRNVVVPEIFLSDNLYYYDAEMGEVKIA